MSGHPRNPIPLPHWPPPAPATFDAYLDVAPAEAMAWLTVDGGLLVQGQGTQHVEFLKIPATSFQHGGWLHVDAPGYVAQDIRVSVVNPVLRHEDGSPVSVALESAVAPFPDPPSREEACRVRVGFQGMYATTQQFGTFPVFGPETTTLNDADLDAYVDQMVAGGFTHLEIAVSWQYREADYSYPVPGRDLSHDLPELRRRILRMIRRGNGRVKGILVLCAGDGLSNPERTYNDPQGWTYGYEWLMENFQRLYNGVIPADEQGPNLDAWVIWGAGYDGCDAYGWQEPQRCRDWWTKARGIIGPQGRLSHEWSSGHGSLGDGVQTYQAEGLHVDTWLQEWGTIHSDDTWQIAARELGPAYRRPPDQPSGDDPHPPWDAHGDTPRGPRFFVAYEMDTGPWVRGRVSLADVNEHRSYEAAVGYPVVC